MIPSAPPTIPKMADVAGVTAVGAFDVFGALAGCGVIIVITSSHVFPRRM
jgi:hypothetical protein